MRSSVRFSVLFALVLLAAESANAMPLWAHHVDLAQHLYLARVILIIGAVAVGAATARGIEEARRWFGPRAR